jgi:hypothetical protein
MGRRVDLHLKRTPLGQVSVQFNTQGAHDVERSWIVVSHEDFGGTSEASHQDQLQMD